ncbi:MAG: sigma-54-dependent Fis family transcriptional regulator [Alphaproteobacteria bacterium]|nr:sigma-54-dependent Fis family transcriptional regulator [Alphaproteobacteria bacterium]
MTYPVLIVEDDETQSKMLSRLLHRRMGFNSLQARNGREALVKLEENENVQSIKLVILDVSMPVMGGMEALEIIRQKYPVLPVIMLTGSRDIDDVVKAMHLGAMDFLVKPYEVERMVITVKNALKLGTLTKEVARLKRQQEGALHFDNLIGHDTGLSDPVALGRKAARSDIAVLISGDTGTGKEVFARAIHGESVRADYPFIAVNCGAIPPQLVESTLFGHEKGAFTGATEKVIGKFREAEGGVIFLDEVGELPLEMQVKLLRVLQQKEVEPVGAGRPLPVNIRVISATNRNLYKEVKKGAFREDLYFRLNVLSINLPSLSQRKGDVLPLASHFVERFCIREGGVPKDLSTVLEASLMEYSWPGNVRELENVINRAMVVSENNILGVDDVLFQDESFDNKGVEYSVKKYFQDELGDIGQIRVVLDNGKFKPIDEIEKEAMRIALDYFDHNVTQAAKALGMAKSTFYKKLKK